MTITQLVTHSGGFHADELLSSVILTRLFPDATVLRSRDKALQAALVDALMQSDAADEVRSKLLDPLAEVESQRRASRAAKAAATKVDFFTMVRGED